MIQDDKERNFADAVAQQTVDNILIVKTRNLFERFDSLGVAFWATGSRLRLGPIAFVVNKAEYNTQVQLKYIKHSLKMASSECPLIALKVRNAYQLRAIQ